MASRVPMKDQSEVLLSTPWTHHEIVLLDGASSCNGKNARTFSGKTEAIHKLEAHPHGLRARPESINPKLHAQSA